MQTHACKPYIFHKPINTRERTLWFSPIVTYPAGEINEMKFSREKKSHGSFTNTFHFPPLLKRWHYRSKRIFTNVIIYFGRTFLTPLKQCHKHCCTHKPVIVITNVLLSGMRDYAFIHTEHYVQFKFPLHSEYILRPWILTWILIYILVFFFLYVSYGKLNNMNNIVRK